MKASEDRGQDRERPAPERKGAHQDRAGATAPRPARLTPGNAAALQRAAGNRAVSTLVRQGSSPPAAAGASAALTAEQTGASPVEAEPVGVQRLAGPAGDPKFAALKADVRGKQKVLAAHKPPTSEASAAQAAAKPPQDDKEAQGKAANAEKMNAAKPGEFDKAAFVKAVNDAIAAQAPKNLDEADKFGDSGKADAVKGQVQGRVADGKKTSAGPIETTTNAPPDLSAAKEKPVTPLAPGQAAATPAAPNPANAIPDKAPPGATDFSAGPAQVDAQMADAQVTEEQLATSNEPQFQDALQDKKAGEQHAATAPGQVRGKEAQTLQAAKAQAGQAGNTAMAGMAGANKAAVAAVSSGKQAAKGSDEAKRAQATAVLQKVFDATKKDVEDILSGLDKKVDDTFSRGEKAARDAFTAEHKRRMDAYKDKRYSGLLGKGRWIKDKFAGLPDEANQIFVTARKGYVDRMQQVISSVADVIGAELGRAKQRIATGRAQLQAEVSKLPKDLQAVGKQAASEFSGKFDELTESVNSKGTELVNTLASKYSEALNAVDAEIEAEKEKNKGLIAKAVDAVGGVIKTILQLKDLLLGVLAKAASAVMAIIKDPIGFLGNLVSAVGAGLRNFMANIGEHLKKGLIGWLIGAMSGAGLQLPQKFDLKGILGMIASLLGLTWAAIRGRIVAKGIPEQAMGAVEAGVPLVAKVQSEGVAGLAEEVKEQVGDLKENLFGKIAEYLIPTVLIAGITWIVSLLNPASAFIKACKMIIDIVTFIIERGAQIIAFVNAVLDAVIAIAGGGTGGVPALIEKALAASVPVLIGALAAILGIGGIADKVKKFFQSLSKPVMKAVDWVVAKIVKLGKSIWAKLKGKGKGKDGKDVPPVKAGKDPRIRELVAADVAAALPDGVSDDKVQPAIRAIMAKRGPQGLDMLEVRKGDGHGQFGIYMAASPVTHIRTTKVDPGDPVARQLMDSDGHPYAEFGLALPRNAILSGSFTLPVAGKPGGYGETHALGELHTRTRVVSYEKKTSKDENRHAEDFVIADVKSTWDAQVGPVEDETAPGAKAPKAVLDLKVTRSPCAQCAPRLGELRVWAKAQKGWDLGIDVASIGLYQGKVETDNGAGKQVTFSRVAGGQEGLRRLKEWGITVRTMSVTDPVVQQEFAKLAPADQLALAVKVEKYNTKLQAAIDHIATVPVVVRKI